MTDAARRDSTVGGIHNEDNPLVADSALVSTQPHIDADARLSGDWWRWCDDAGCSI